MDAAIVGLRAVSLLVAAIGVVLLLRGKRYGALSAIGGLAMFAYSFWLFSN